MKVDSKMTYLVDKGFYLTLKANIEVIFRLEEKVGQEN